MKRPLLGFAVALLLAAPARPQSPRPRDPVIESTVQKAVALVKAHHEPQALQLLDRAVGEHPQSLKLIFLRAKVHLKIKDLDGAERDGKLMLQLQPASKEGKAVVAKVQQLRAAGPAAVPSPAASPAPVPSPSPTPSPAKASPQPAATPSPQPHPSPAPSARPSASVPSPGASPAARPSPRPSASPASASPSPVTTGSPATGASPHPSASVRPSPSPSPHK